MNGAAMLALAVLTVRRHWFAPWLTGTLGVGMIIWIDCRGRHPARDDVLTGSSLAIGLALGFIAAVLAPANRAAPAMVTAVRHPAAVAALKAIHTVIFAAELSAIFWLVVSGLVGRRDRTVGSPLRPWQGRWRCSSPTTGSARSHR